MRATKTLILGIGLWAAGSHLTSADPYAIEIVRAQGPFGSGPYGDPAAVLGAPATRFYDPYAGNFGSQTNGRVKLVEAAYNIAPDTNGLPTPNLLLTLGTGSEVIVRFDTPITNRPANPYGIDLLVFGNTFYAASGAVSDNANMNTLQIPGGAFTEPLKVSVSPGYTGLPNETPEDPDTWPWYRYESGPYGDTVFPTHAFVWDRAAAAWTDELMDFTKPVNPAMQNIIAGGGLTAADAIDLYAGAGGGTGFDLSESGFDWIQYVKVDGLEAAFSVGEIDALSAVTPRIIGDTLTIAPGNIQDGTAALWFQWAGAIEETQLRLTFTAIGDVSRVNTATIAGFGSYPTLPGVPLNAVQLELIRLLGNGNSNFAADLALSTGRNYHGDGSDLQVLKPKGGNWDSLPFSYDSGMREVLVTGQTELTALVLVQAAAPSLQLSSAIPDVVAIEFTPVLGNLHVLERSTNLTSWETVTSFVATNTQPVSLADTTAPPDCAYYRLRMSSP